MIISSYFLGFLLRENSAGGAESDFIYHTWPAIQGIKENFLLAIKNYGEFKEGSARAKFALENYIDQLARGLANVINILDPEIIVLGGGMSNVNFICENINKQLIKYVVSDTFHTKVVKNKHGDSSGVRGAAWL